MFRLVLVIGLGLSKAFGANEAALKEAWISLPDASENYSEVMKQEIGPQQDASRGYTDAERSKMPKPAIPEEHYSEALKQSDPDLAEKVEGAQDYTDREVRKLEPVQEDETASVIQSVRSGKNQLQFKKRGRIKASFGGRYGVSMNRKNKASPGKSYNDFSDLYGTGHVPDVTFVVESLPLYRENLGSLGLFGTAGFSRHQAKGLFGVPLINPVTGNRFDARGTTEFTFFTIPLVFGVSGRLDVARIIIPMARVGFSVIGFRESRNDDKAAIRGYSKGYSTAVGALVPLNFLSSSSESEYYYSFAVKRYSLSVEYTRLDSFSGDVDFSVSGLSAGLLFEY